MGKKKNVAETNPYAMRRIPNEAEWQAALSDMTQDKAIEALNFLQLVYADGHGTYGPVIAEFSGILTRYHQLFYKWAPFKEESTEEAGEIGMRLMKSLIGAALMCALFLAMLHFGAGGILLAVFYIAAGAAMSILSGQGYFAFLEISFCLIFQVLGALVGSDGNFDLRGLDEKVFWIALVIFVFEELNRCVQSLKAGWKTKRENAKNRKLAKAEDEEMRAAQKKLIEMTPALVQEYGEVRAKYVEKLRDFLTPEQRKNMFRGMPEHFWWEIPVENLRKLDDSVTTWVSGKTAWETHWVQREYGREFQYAGEEYSPILGNAQSKEETKRFYDEVKASIMSQGGSGIFDFISRGGSSVMEEETVHYQDFKYSDMTRFREEMSYLALGHKIDQAYQEKSITDRDYDDLKNAYFFLGMEKNDVLDQKVDKTTTEFRERKSFKNVWTGQVLLTNNTERDGVVLVDYRTRLTHLFHNLNLLSDVKITRVLGTDATLRDPVVMAKIHKVCEDCD